MLGVDGVVFHRGVEPEAVAVLFAVVEGRLELFATTPATAPAAAPPRARAGPLLAVLRVPLGLLAVLRVALGLLLGLRLRLLGGCGLDLRLDLVAEIDFPGAGVILVGGEPVLFAELAQLRGADFELVGDPGVRAALAYPGADLVELGLE